MRKKRARLRDKLSVLKRIETESQKTTGQEYELRLMSVVDEAMNHAIASMEALSDFVATLRSWRQQLEPGHGNSARPNTHKDPLDMLTHRQREIFGLLAGGKSSKETAAVLGISPKTADAHRAQIMHKLSLHSQSDLIFFAIRAGLVKLK